MTLPVGDVRARTLRAGTVLVRSGLATVLIRAELAGPELTRAERAGGLRLLAGRRAERTRCGLPLAERLIAVGTVSRSLGLPVLACRVRPAAVGAPRPGILWSWPLWSRALRTGARRAGGELTWPVSGRPGPRPGIPVPVSRLARPRLPVPVTVLPRCCLLPVRCLPGRSRPGRCLARRRPAGTVGALPWLVGRERSAPVLSLTSLARRALPALRALAAVLLARAGTAGAGTARAGSAGAAAGRSAVRRAGPAAVASLRAVRVRRLAVRRGRRLAARPVPTRALRASRGCPGRPCGCPG